MDNGNLLVGNKVLLPRIALTSPSAPASENGPLPAEIVVSRRGDLAASVSVNLQISGSALNGVDYTMLPSKVIIPAGQASVTLTLAPYVDAITELREVVEIVVLEGAGYITAEDNHAVAVIDDLMPQITIEALESVAVKSGSQPGVFLVRRAGVIDRSVLVRLTVGGTAANGVDYETVQAYMNLAAGQTTGLLEIKPRTSAVISGGSEYVRLGIAPDATYAVMTPSAAIVSIIEEFMTFEQWRDRYFPESSGELDEFAAGDDGQTGVRNFTRYAFGLSPTDPTATAGRPVFDMRDGRLVAAFRRPANVTDVAYFVEVSDDLETWSADAGVIEQTQLPEYGNSPEMSGWRTVRTQAEADRQFVRVRAVYQP